MVENMKVTVHSEYDLTYKVDIDTNEFYLEPYYQYSHIIYHGNGENIPNIKGNKSCSFMFKNFSKDVLDLTNFDMSEVEYFDKMFNYSKMRKLIMIGNKLDPQADGQDLFNGCDYLEEVVFDKYTADLVYEALECPTVRIINGLRVKLFKEEDISYNDLCVCLYDNIVKGLSGIALEIAVGTSCWYDCPPLSDMRAILEYLESWGYSKEELCENIPKTNLFGKLPKGYIKEANLNDIINNKLVNEKVTIGTLVTDLYREYDKDVVNDNVIKYLWNQVLL